MEFKKALVTVTGVTTILLASASMCMAKTAVVNTETLKLRKGPSTSTTILELLDEGEKLEVIEEEGEWVKVKVSGITGYVSKEFVKISGENSESSTQKENTQTTSNTNTETNTAVAQNNEEVSNIISETTANSENTEAQNTESENTSENAENEKQETTITEVNQQETIKENFAGFTVKQATTIADTDIFILPLINANKISNIKQNDQITIIDEVKSWYYIQTQQVNGWIQKNAVKLDENTQQASTGEPEQNNNNSKNENAETNTQVNEKTNTAVEQEQTSEKTNATVEQGQTSEKTIEEKTMYVNTSSIYVRKGPGTNYNVVDTLILNDAVTVTAESGDWYKVKVNNKTDGYIAKRLLSDSKQTVTSRSADERTLSEETKVEEKAEEVKESTAENEKQTSKGEEIVNFAKKYLGCKYVYGGSGPSTFDCSGFTMFVYKNFGVSLSHSATAQSKKGTYVEKSNLQPGDLVFFKDYETMVGIGHCGIYIGGGEFIHASSGTGYCVKISTLLSGSYSTRYETARRIF